MTLILESFRERISHLAEFPESDPAPFIAELADFASRPNRQSAHFYPMVFEAIARFCAPALTAILEAGANPDYSPRDRVSPLAQAIRQNHPPLVKTLLEAGADPNGLVLPDGSAQRCLDYALRHRHFDIGLLLLDAGADPRFCDSVGLTPLHLAVRAEHPATVAALLARGADPAIDHGAGSALAMAQSLGASECAEILICYADAVALANSMPQAAPGKTLSL